MTGIGDDDLFPTGDRTERKQTRWNKSDVH
jgi:hypothetical protein